MVGRQMKLYLVGLVFVFFPDIIKCQDDPADIPYNDCGGADNNQIASIRVTGCEKDEICEITMEDLLTIKVNWETHQSSITTLNSKLYVQFFHGFKKEVNIVPIDACDYLKCPLTTDTTVNYVANFTVPGENEILPGEGRIWWYGFQKTLDDLLLCVNFRVNILRKDND